MSRIHLDDLPAHMTAERNANRAENIQRARTHHRFPVDRARVAFDNIPGLIDRNNEEILEATKCGCDICEEDIIPALTKANEGHRQQRKNLAAKYGFRED